MSEPEISRRCLACGASVRRQARFCPQCGRSMVVAPPVDRAAELPVEDRRRSGARRRGEAEAPAAPLKSNAPTPDRPAAPPYSNRPRPPEAAAAITDPPALRSKAPGETSLKQQCTEAEGNSRPPAGKLRDASIFVLDEASGDPGVRFVLIAIAIFIVFLLFLLINNILR